MYARMAVYADKAYCTSHAEHVAVKKSCTLRAVKKNNMKIKDRKTGIAKNQYAEFMKAICFNLKQLSVLDPQNLVLT